MDCSAQIGEGCSLGLEFQSCVLLRYFILTVRKTPSLQGGEDVNEIAVESPAKISGDPVEPSEWIQHLQLVHYNTWNSANW